VPDGHEPEIIACRLAARQTPELLQVGVPTALAHLQTIFGRDKADAFGKQSLQCRWGPAPFGVVGFQLPGESPGSSLPCNARRIVGGCLIPSQHYKIVLSLRKNLKRFSENNKDELNQSVVIVAHAAPTILEKNQNNEIH
jgi:hypothetical protein